jgi:uncharacterized protein (DUF1330 family)
MKSQFTVSLAILAGVGIGAVAVQTLHAQNKPPVYFVGETEISNMDAYAKEYLPVVMADIKANGGRYIAAGKATPFEGEPPKTRIVVIAFDSLEKSRRGAVRKGSRRPGRSATNTRNTVLTPSRVCRSSSHKTSCVIEAGGCQSGAASFVKL